MGSLTESPQRTTDPPFDGYRGFDLVDTPAALVAKLARYTELLSNPDTPAPLRQYSGAIIPEIRAALRHHALRTGVTP